MPKILPIVIAAACLLLCFACTTMRPIGNAGLVIDLSRKSTAEVIKELDRDDMYANNNWLFIRGDSAEKLLPRFELIGDINPVAMKYCGNAFDVQPNLLDGALMNVFLSDRRIDAIRRITIEGHQLPMQYYSCFTVYGEAVKLKSM